MNILLINDNKYIVNEMTDFLKTNNSELFLVESTQQAVHVLSKNIINVVLINMNSISDIGLVKYINDNFPNVRVFLTVENQIEEAISVFKNGSYKLLSNPMKLQELKKIMEN